MPLSSILNLSYRSSAVAVIDPVGERSRNDLIDEAGHLASKLSSAIPPTQRVGVVATPTIRGVINVLAALTSGRSCAMLPVDGIGSDEPLEIARAAGCGVVLREDTRVEVDADQAAPLVTESTDYPGSTERLVLFTSGTTSRPRGVRLSEANLVAHLTAMLRTAVPWDHSDRLGQILTLSHSFGISMALLALSRQTPLVMLPDAPPGRSLADALDRHDLTAFACVPYLLRLLATRGIDLGGSTVAGLRHLYLAGGGVSDSDLKSLLPNYRGETYLMYGLTEATARVAVRRSSDNAPSNSVGLPLPGIHVRCVGPDGSPLQPGATGRIQVFSPTLMIGYLGDEPRPHGEPVTTTDLGHLDEAGNLFITGREAEMMNFRGNRVSLPSIEARINSVPGVAESRLKLDSEAEDALAELLLVLAPDADPHEVKRLALRAVVPRGLIGRVSFVTDLPKTRSGKAIRH